MDSIRILWIYPYPVDIIRITHIYSRSMDIIHILWIYPHFVDIIRISWILYALDTLRDIHLVMFVMLFKVLFWVWILFILVALRAT